MRTENQPGLDSESMEEVVVETPELDGNSSDSELPAGVSLVMAELQALLEADEAEEDATFTYVAPMAICNRHGFYANIDVALDVPVSRDRKEAQCPGGHTVKVNRQKVFGTHGGNIRRISPH